MLNEYPDVLTVKQVAEVLHLCENSTYRLIKQGRIGVLKVGRKILVPKRSLRVFLDSAQYKVSHL